MKAQELRIGNFINIAGFTQTVLATAEGGWIETESYNCYIGEIHNTPNPIPLTEEWLFKFGFNVENLYSIDVGRKCIKAAKAQDEDILILYRADIGLDFYSIEIVEYVHQLQNLYFALTGEELKTK